MHLDAARAVYPRAVNWLRNQGSDDETLLAAIEGLADIDIRLKHYEEAVKDFAWLAERWPDRAWFQYRYGVALGLAGQLHRSIRILQQVQENMPESASVYSKIGFAYLQLRDSEQAAQYFNEALMLDAFEPFALYHLARLRALQGYTDRSRQLFARLCKIEQSEDSALDLSRLLDKG